MQNKILIINTLAALILLLFPIITCAHDSCLELGAQYHALGICMQESNESYDEHGFRECQRWRENIKSRLIDNCFDSCDYIASVYKRFSDNEKKSALPIFFTNKQDFNNVTEIIIYDFLEAKDEYYKLYMVFYLSTLDAATVRKYSQKILEIITVEKDTNLQVYLIDLAFKMREKEMATVIYYLKSLNDPIMSRILCAYAVRYENNKYVINNLSECF